MKEGNMTGSAPETIAPSPFPITIEGRKKVGELLRVLLADFFTLYLKTKNFHWHMRGAHFRDYHLLLDEQAEELHNATDAIAERARKIGETTLRSIGDIARHQRLNDADASEIDGISMLRTLCNDNNALAIFMREAHEVCEATGDLATTSLLENWIDEAERRSWFLSATVNSVS
jgi:starvation-inducible DNA-binding protein